MARRYRYRPGHMSADQFATSLPASPATATVGVRLSIRTANHRFDPVCIGYHLLRLSRRQTLANLRLYLVRERSQVRASQLMIPKLEPDTHKPEFEPQTDLYLPMYQWRRCIFDLELPGDVVSSALVGTLPNASVSAVTMRTRKELD